MARRPKLSDITNLEEDLSPILTQFSNEEILSGSSVGRHYNLIGDWDYSTTTVGQNAARYTEDLGWAYHLSTNLTKTGQCQFFSYRRRTNLVPKSILYKFLWKYSFKLQRCLY